MDTPSLPCLPEHLRGPLSQLVEARYINNVEEAAGWRELLREEENADGTEVYVAARDIQAEETVFLIDHLWCTTLFAARAHLQAHRHIRSNMRYICGLEEDEEENESFPDQLSDTESTTWEDTVSGNEALPSLGSKEDIAKYILQHTRNAELDLDAIIPRRSQAAFRFLKGVLEAIPCAVPGLETLSLRENCLDGACVPALRRCLQLLPSLKAVWLNENPGLYDDAQDPYANLTGIFDGKLLETRLEIVNRRLTPAYGKWAIRYLGEVGEAERREKAENRTGISTVEMDRPLIVALDLSDRQLPSLKPAIFMTELPKLRRLDLRGNPLLTTPQTPRAWESLLYPTLHALPCLESLWVDDPVIISIVASAEQGPPGPAREEESADKADADWEEALARTFPQLGWINGRSIVRYAEMGHGTQIVVSKEGGTVAESMDKIVANMWPHMEPLRLAASEKCHPEVYWYAMDVPGQRIRHHASGRGGPGLSFLPMQDRGVGVSFTAAWPRCTLEAGQEVTRDVLAGFPRPPAWDTDGSDWERLQKRVLGALGRGEDGCSHGQDPGGSVVREELGGDCASEGRRQGRRSEAIDANDGAESSMASRGRAPAFPIPVGGRTFPPSRPLSVYTDMPVLVHSLDLPARFYLTDHAQDADILWATPAFFASHVPQSARGRRQWKATLPFLGEVDDKCQLVHLLTRLSHTRSQLSIPWLPRSYCLPEDLPRLLDDWETPSSRPPSAPPSTWILKPPHLARGWDIALTRSLPCILRHLQASGRLLVSDYLTSPDLWLDGHKYDLRMYVLLLSPSLVLIHRQFRVRRASQPYSMALEHLEDLRIHLTNTTLGLSGLGQADAGGEEGHGCPTETVSCLDFVEKWESLHPGREGWEGVRRRIDSMLRECFSLIGRAGGREGGREALHVHDPYGRALVGVDVLLDRATLSPHLIEINASPNISGMLSERPGFSNEVFSAAFIEGGWREDGNGFYPLIDQQNPNEGCS